MAALLALIPVACEPSLGVHSTALTHSHLDTGHPAVGRIACGATLIGSRSVLSAAHCAPAANSSFVAGGLSVRVSRVVVHPAFNTNATLEGRPSEGDGWFDNDLSVAILEREVTELEPIPLAREPHEVGDAIVLVGFGSPALGEPGGTKRTAANVIGAIATRYFMYGDGVSADGKPSVLCNNDSGGPTLVLESGEERLLGVHSMQHPSCIDFGYDMRVPAFVDWLREVTKGNLGVSAVGRPDAGGPPHQVEEREAGGQALDGAADAPAPAARSRGCSIAGPGSARGSEAGLLLVLALGLMARRRGR